ncbi:hypothetical protein UPYG_G00162950 [Umbra pygmaea]|uniref:Uncharacterized protein n=1 Tax=Umbra pygmaea TaxID=75934 RepID=A0ABD0WLZ3_UMBPY
MHFLKNCSDEFTNVFFVCLVTRRVPKNVFSTEPAGSCMLSTKPFYIWPLLNDKCFLRRQLYWRVRNTKARVPDTRWRRRWGGRGGGGSGLNRAKPVLGSQQTSKRTGQMS